MYTPLSIMSLPQQFRYWFWNWSSIRWLAELSGLSLNLEHRRKGSQPRLFVIAEVTTDLLTT